MGAEAWRAGQAAGKARAAEIYDLLLLAGREGEARRLIFTDVTPDQLRRQLVRDQVTTGKTAPTASTATGPAAPPPLVQAMFAARGLRLAR